MQFMISLQNGFILFSLGVNFWIIGVKRGYINYGIIFDSADEQGFCKLPL